MEDKVSVTPVTVCGSFAFDLQKVIQSILYAP
jgi:hypothetical protein